MAKNNKEMLTDMYQQIGRMHDEFVVNRRLRVDIFEKNYKLERENADLKARLEVYDKFFNMLNSANPNISDPNEIAFRYNGELYFTDKWNVEAMDVNSMDSATVKQLHLTLRCID